MEKVEHLSIERTIEKDALLIDKGAFSDVSCYETERHRARDGWQQRRFVCAIEFAEMSQKHDSGPGTNEPRHRPFLK